MPSHLVKDFPVLCPCNSREQDVFFENNFLAQKQNACTKKRIRRFNFCNIVMIFYFKQQV